MTPDSSKSTLKLAENTRERAVTMPANMDMAVVTKSTKLYTCGRNKIMR
jgi:hypothetical protein